MIKFYLNHGLANLKYKKCYLKNNGHNLILNSFANFTKYIIQFSQKSCLCMYISIWIFKKKSYFF